MKITCNTFDEFMSCIYGCTTRGLLFEADASSLTIKLTGGF